MTTPAKFRQADVTRAVKGAQAAGIRVGRIQIDPRGQIVIDAASESGAPKKSSSWDDVLP